ncbi:TrkA family potassium uptake protein [uncultured Veillonella sp.]|uniref:potassium channel family protein n=1 Tax=uncultured Veillonella sp. TaxID=159268 RepID=UPI0025F8F04D|nr:TrkA family potassium uptake protein [uncultured Veillonella sp.]MDY3974741.1 TrkA family potassium uptake protein [Veillonella caviae]
MKRKSIGIIGLGRFGSTLAKKVTALGHEVYGVDRDEKVVQKLAPYIAQSVVADFTDEDTIAELHLETLDMVVIAIGEEMNAKLLTAMVLKDLKSPYIVAKASSLMESKLLKKVGVDFIVYPEIDMAERVAQMLSGDHIVDYFQLSKDIGIVEIKTPNFMVDKSLKELELRKSYNVNVVAIKRNNEVMAPPDPNDKLRATDMLILIGQNDEITKLGS